jgi:hypothetical protein
MPDTAQLEMPGSDGGGGSSHNWIVIVGAIAGVVGLVLLLKNQGGGGTTAAGTSINAALGSIQEENMNLLGTTQAGFMQTQQGLASGFATTNQGLTNGFLNTQQSFGALGTQISGGFTNTNDLLGHLEADLTGQLTAFSGQTQANYAGLSNLISSGQATQAQFDQQHLALLTSIQNDVTAGLVGQQQANQTMAGIETQVGIVSGQVNVVGNQVSGLWGPLQNIIMRQSVLSNQIGYGPGQ